MDGVVLARFEPIGLDRLSKSYAGTLIFYKEADFGGRLGVHYSQAPSMIGRSDAIGYFECFIAID